MKESLTKSNIKEIREVFDQIWLIFGKDDCRKSGHYDGVDIPYFESKLQISRKVEKINESRWIIFLIMLLTTIICFLLWYLDVSDLNTIFIFSGLTAIICCYLRWMYSKTNHEDVKKIEKVRVIQESMRVQTYQELELLNKAVDYLGYDIDHIVKLREGMTQMYLSQDDSKKAQIKIHDCYIRNLSRGDKFELERIDSSEYRTKTIVKYKKIIGHLL